MEDKKITISITEVMKMAAEAGAKAAMDRLNREKQERLKTRYDRRLRNTEILLRNYRTFVIHKNEAVYSSSKAVEILDELDSYEFEDEMYVESIKKSKERTSIIVSHVDKMLNVFRYMSDSNPRPEEQRKFKTIFALYIDEKQKTPEEICTEMSVNQRTLYRDRKAGIQILSGLLFGVDGIKLT